MSLHHSHFTSEPFQVEMKRVLLEKLRIEYRGEIPAHVFQNAEVDCALEAYSDSVRLHLRTYLTANKWTERWGCDEYMKIPLTWFDMLRHEHFPKFLVKKFPIKYREIMVRGGESTNYWIFPEVPPNPNKDIQSFIMNYTEVANRSRV